MKFVWHHYYNTKPVWCKPPFEKNFTTRPPYDIINTPPSLKNHKKEGTPMIKGFKMHLHPGMEEEYQRRHDALWPEMKDMIHQYGGKNYSIFLDRETLTLFGYIEIESEEKWSRSAETAICQKWWAYMADIMDTNPDNSPVSIDLVPVFHLD